MGHGAIIADDQQNSESKTPPGPGPASRSRKPSMTSAEHPDNDNASHDLEKGGHEERVDQSRAMSTVQVLWPRHIFRRLKNPTQDVKIDSSRKRQQQASANPEDVEESDRRFVAKKKGTHHATPLQVYLDDRT